MDQTQPGTINLWIIIGAYVVPSIVALGTYFLQTRKNKAEVSKIGSDIEHQESEDDLNQGKLSLEWAREFKTRLDEVERINAQNAADLAVMRLRNLELEGKVRTLEEENQDLKAQIINLQTTNRSLTIRVQELEIENTNLRQTRELTQPRKES